MVLFVWEMFNYKNYRVVDGVKFKFEEVFYVEKKKVL